MVGELITAYEEHVDRTRDALGDYEQSALKLGKVILEWHRSGEFGVDAEGNPRKSVAQAFNDEFPGRYKSASSVANLRDYAASVEKLTSIEGADEEKIKSLPQSAVRALEPLLAEGDTGDPKRALEVIESVSGAEGGATAEDYRDKVSELLSGGVCDDEKTAYDDVDEEEDCRGQEPEELSEDDVKDKLLWLEKTLTECRVAVNEIDGVKPSLVAAQIDEALHGAVALIDQW